MGTARQARESRGRERGVVLMLSFFVIIILIAVVGLMFVESQVDSAIAHSRERALQIDAAEADAFHYAQALLLADLARTTEVASVGLLGCGTRGDHEPSAPATVVQRQSDGRNTRDAPHVPRKSGEKRNILADQLPDSRFYPRGYSR